MSYMHTETLIIRDGRVICSTAEARRWEDDECMPKPGDMLARYRTDGSIEIGRIGMRAAMSDAEDTPADSNASIKE